MAYSPKEDLKQGYSQYKLDEVKNIFYGKVVSVDDEYNMSRIRVRLMGIDDKVSDNQLPICQPLLPKFIHIIPKVGEAVKILISDINKPYRLRFWIGSVISQHERIYKETYDSALTGTEYERVQPTTSYSTIPNASDIFPDIEDIALIGRDNTDIVLKKKEVRLRAGKHNVKDILKLNDYNPSYIRLKISNSGDRSHSIVGGDYIFLLSSKEEKKYKYNISDDELKELYTKLEPLVKGNILKNVLELFRSAIIQHVHGYSNMKADESNVIQNLMNLDLEKILSKGSFIN